MKKYIREDNWKIIEETDGNILLFDLNTPPGLTETADVAAQHPDLIDKIREKLINYKDPNTRFILQE